MDVKKKILLFILIICFFLMSSAFAVYVISMNLNSKSAVLEGDDEEQPADFDIDYDILAQDLILEATHYVIDFNITYHGEDPLYFWDLEFNIPEDAIIEDIVGALYTLENGIIKVSNLMESAAILSEETFTFTISFASSDDSYLPTNFAIGDYIVKEILRAKLESVLNRISSAGNIHTYQIIINNKGNGDAENWRLSLSSHASLQIRSLVNANYIQQPTLLILSSLSGQTLISGGGLTIDLSFMSNVKNWYPEIVDLSVTELVDYE